MSRAGKRDGRRWASRAAVVALFGLASCKSADEKIREGLVGIWERAGTNETATYERRFFPTGVYVEKRHDTATMPPPGGRDTIESGTYRVQGERIYFEIIDAAIAPEGAHHEGAVTSIDKDELVLEEQASAKWTRRRDPLPDNPPEVTAKALEKARLELSRASGCLLGGRLDAGPAWPRLIAVSRGVALLPEPSEAAKKVVAWPLSCAPAVGEARLALDELLTKDALERCGKLRRLLRGALFEPPSKVADYGKVASEHRRIDAIASEAERCKIVGDPPADGVPKDRGRPAAPAMAVERGAPVTLTGTLSLVVEVAAASPSAESVRFVIGSRSPTDGSKLEAASCATRGGAAVSGVRCEPLEVKAGDVIRPLTSLAEDASLWATVGSSSLSRPKSPELTLRADYSLEGRAYVDRDGTVKGTSGDGTELRVTADGRSTETPGARASARVTPRGDLRLTSTEEGFVVSRTGDVDPAKLGKTRLTKSYRDVEPCHDGNHFGFVAHDETRIVAGVPRIDGSLALVDVEVAADSDRSDQARSITCEPGVIRFVWLSREARVVRVTCKLDGCTLDRSEPLPDRGPGALGITSIGERVLVTKQAALPAAELGLRGQVVYRVADLAQLATAPDRLLLVEPDIDTPDAAEPERFSLIASTFATRSAAIIAVTSTSGLYLFRVDSDGFAKPIAP